MRFNSSLSIANLAAKNGQDASSVYAHRLKIQNFTFYIINHIFYKLYILYHNTSYLHQNVMISFQSYNRYELHTRDTPVQGSYRTGARDPEQSGELPYYEAGID